MAAVDCMPDKVCVAIDYYIDLVQRSRSYQFVIRLFILLSRMRSLRQCVFQLMTIMLSMKRLTHGNCQSLLIQRFHGEVLENIIIIVNLNFSTV
jgi:hypothetical protein